MLQWMCSLQNVGLTSLHVFTAEMHLVTLVWPSATAQLLSQVQLHNYLDLSCHQQEEHCELVERLGRSGACSTAAGKDNFLLD